jgi:predicted amidohydrolase YtcJ
MRAVVKLILFASLIVAGNSAVAQQNPTTADTLFLHGNIYTVNPQQPKAEAIAVSQGKIVFVGSDAEAARFQGPNTRVVDFAGKTVVPGLTDSHCHLSGVGAREVELNLEGTTSLPDFLAKVKSHIDQAKPDQWITGRGWIETSWMPPVFPTRDDLDRISPHNPVWLTRADGHGAVANSTAIRLAGITHETSDPFGGEIMRNRETGEPSGMFLDNAQALITKHIPPRPSAENLRDLERGAKRNQALGWTALGVPSSSLRELTALEELYKEGRIKLRIDLALLGPSDDAGWLLKHGPTVGAFGDRLTCRAIKVSFDGALGSKGAALLETYSDYDTRGLLKWTDDDLLPMFEESLRKGIQIWTHAIGDRANHEILRLYEKAFTAVPSGERRVKEPRWRVEHAQIVAPADIPRFAALGVIPSMQPSHAIGDLHFAASRLGLKRLEGAYAWQSFLKAGSIIPGGSDAPVERGEPMIEFYAAVARKDLKGYSGEGWHPEQAVSREQALKMLTIWPAYAAFAENSRGTIEPGKLADFTVLSNDIMRIPEAEILTTKCAMTVINGEIVYDGSKP